MAWRRAAIAAVLAFLIYRTTFVRKLVWLNAAAISEEAGRWILVPVAVLEVLALALVLWSGLEKLAKFGKEKLGVRKVH